VVIFDNPGTVSGEYSTRDDGTIAEDDIEINAASLGKDERKEHHSECSGYGKVPCSRFLYRY